MKTILVITDGIGVNDEREFNAFAQANKPTYDELFKSVPYGLIHTYGMYVGLPNGQMGNSEVGHMSLGSGRVLYQDLVKINKAIAQDSLKDNKELKKLESCKRVHLVGLASDGGVHSHLNHMLALANILQENKEVLLHLITDGRDVLPKSALKYLETIEKEIAKKNIKIASLSGRFYAMDRDKRWDRIEEAYKVIAQGKNLQNCTPQEYIELQYKEGIFDEFILPASFLADGKIQADDGLIFTNYRSDRAREIVSALGDENFDEFKRENFIKIPLLNMCEYDKNFNYPILFPKDTIKNTLAEIISKNNLRQLHTAETEKYAHVTFFFNGGIEEPYPNETRVLIPSPKVKTYDEKPEMSAKEVGDAVLKAMDEEYDFIVVNFANGDMVGHTGVFEAAKKAVEAVDSELGRIRQKAKEKDYAFVLTSDHGNCEKMQNQKGEILTNHTVGDVWCFIEAKGISEVKDGSLDNIAPSVLKLMGLEIPKEMSESLI